MPPVSGGAKRLLRLIEAAEEADIWPTLLVLDPPSVESRVLAEQRDWNVVYAPDDPTPTVTRAMQHLNRFVAPVSRIHRELLARLARPDMAFVQFEGIGGADLLPLIHHPTRIFSTQNVEADIVRPETVRSPTLVRGLYHWERVRRAETRAARRASHVLCVSEADCDRFRRSSSRVVLAPNGVDDAFFDIPAPSQGGADVFFFGQMTYAPNRLGLIRWLHEGWPVVRREVPEARLVVAGAGSESMDLSDVDVSAVRLLGRVDDLAETIEACDVHIVPIWQGGGTRLKALEALASGRPVVGTRLGVGGIGFCDGEHGVAADRPADLARELIALLRDPDRRATFAANGRELAERFRWRDTLARARAIYAAAG